MGRGDQRTKRGKIFRGTHGKLRPKKKVKRPQPAPAPVVDAAPETPETAETPQPTANE